MKIALCLSGVPRGIYCHELIQRLSHLYEVHVFMYYWLDGESIRQHSFNGKPTFPFNPESLRFPGVELYYHGDYFEKYIPEFQKQFEKIDLEKRLRKDLGIFGMTYGIYMANLMREEYEYKNSMNFDCVFRVRFESGFREWRGPHKLWLVSDYNMNHLWIPDINVDTHTGMNDQFAFSGPKVMSYYSRVYEKVVELSNEGFHSPELIFNKHLRGQYFNIYCQAKLA